MELMSSGTLLGRCLTILNGVLDTLQGSGLYMSTTKTSRGTPRCLHIGSKSCFRRRQSDGHYVELVLDVFVRRFCISIIKIGKFQIALLCYEK